VTYYTASRREGRGLAQQTVLHSLGMWKELKNKREILSWCFFDFANSSFTTIIVTIVFSVYFVRIIAGGSHKADFYWSLANFLSQALVLLSAPLVGAIADFSAFKKRFLFLTYVTCVLFTALLALIEPGQIFLAICIFAVANFAFSSGENLIASFLPEIVLPQDMGKISGLGWALGYVGGLLCLLLCFPLVAGGFGLDNLFNLRMTNLVVAGFFLIAGVPTFLWVRERKTAGTLPPGTSYLRTGFRRIGETFREVRRFRQLFRFLVVFGIYNCGVTTVVVFSSVYAYQTIHLSPTQLLWFFLITQVSASLGAFLFGLVQDRIGATHTIRITLALWLVVILGAFLSSGRTTFYIVGNLAGIGIGSSQSAARAMVGLLTPPEKTAEFFGFWGTSWKLSTAVGPLAFGLLSMVTGSQRLALAATGSFFLVGLIGLSAVREKEGIEAARLYNSGRPPAQEL
jgi:UMF1 family MFS transporter